METVKVFTEQRCLECELLFQPTDHPWRVAGYCKKSCEKTRNDRLALLKTQGDAAPR